MTSLEQRRIELVDAIIDLPSAIAAASIFLRLSDAGLPSVYRERLRALDLLEAVRGHFTRINAEPEYDQNYAVERLIAGIRDGVAVQALLGPGGSGKTHVFARKLLPTLRAEFGDAIAVTSPTNLGVNVLGRHGVSAATNHQALYALGFGPSVVAVQAWIVADGVGPLPDDVSPRLAAAWRNTTAGPRERARKKAGNNAVESALREIGLAGGFMEILPPRWDLRQDPDAIERTELACWCMDEAGMATSTVLEDVQRFTGRVILIGDSFQLPAILEVSEVALGVVGALARVPLSYQVHLFHDRRTKGETQHLRAAQAVLQDTTTLADITRWSQTGAIPGLMHARLIDIAKLVDAPVLCFYRNSVVRIAVECRRSAGLPDDQLVPGERLLIENIARDRRETLAGMGITKNSRVIVLQQTSPYQVTVIAEGVLEQLIATCANEDREPTRGEIEALAASVPLGVSYTRDELEGAGVALTDRDTSHGWLAPIRGQAVNARFAYASTTHKAQGSSYRFVQISADDMFGYARSTYGNEIAPDLPVPVWRRLVYTALTRGEEGVIWVTEGRRYRAIGTNFAGSLNATDLEQALPVALHGLDQQAAAKDLDAALDMTGGGRVTRLRSETLNAAEIADTNSAPVVTLPPKEQEVDDVVVPYPRARWQRPAAAELLTPIDPADLDPEISADLLDWLMKYPERIPQRMPLGDAIGSIFEFGLERDARFRFRRVYIARLDPRGRTVRLSVLRSNDRRLREIPPDFPKWTPLDFDDAAHLERQLNRLRTGDTSLFAGLAKCGVCGRTLSDPVSRRYGIGPVCATRLGMVMPTIGRECAS
jgi:hypothetical protein